MMFILWLAFAGLVGAAASKMKRSFLGWFILAILISPLLAGIILTICWCLAAKND